VDRLKLPEPLAERGYAPRFGACRAPRCYNAKDFAPLRAAASRRFMVFILALIFIGASWFTAIRGRDAWPFTGYPMFSRPVRAERLRVFRIALEYPDGSSRWWRPHYYKLQQEFGQDFGRAASLPLPQRLERLYRLRVHIAHCLKHDPAAAGATGYSMVLRTTTPQPGGNWKTVDEVVERTVLEGIPQQAPASG